MRLEELKKGFWGYRKEPVFQYLTQIEDACARKLREREEQMEALRRQSQERIQALEEENRALREELEKLRAQQDHISQAILDARASAERLRAESQAQEEAARERVRRTLEKEYQERIAALREAIRQTLEDLERQAETLERETRELAAASPAANLSLFQ